MANESAWYLQSPPLLKLPFIKYLLGREVYSHFTKEVTEAQRGKVRPPRSGKARTQTLLRPSPNPCAHNSPPTTPLQIDSSADDESTVPS